MGDARALWQGRQGTRMSKLTVYFFIQIVTVKGDSKKSQWEKKKTQWKSVKRMCVTLSYQGLWEQEGAV